VQTGRVDEVEVPDVHDHRPGERTQGTDDRSKWALRGAVQVTAELEALDAVVRRHLDVEGGLI
jgi:hypothetical protein